MVKHIAYKNGTIRNVDGKLIAFYDEAEKTLSIDGFLLSFFAEDWKHAMEIVGRRYGEK